MADSLSHEAPVHGAAALPVTVPARLVGRDALLGRVYTFLKENRPVQVIGAAGTGRTALAATLAAAYTEQPGGVLWLDVHNSSIDTILVRIGRAYGVREITSTEHPLGMVGAVANTLTRHKPLIVLDGTLDEQVAQAFVARCASGLPVLFATSSELSDSWAKIELGNLDTAHGAALYRLNAGLPETDDADVDRIVELLQGNPFALCLAGATARATRQAPGPFAAILSQIPGAATADPVLLALTVAFRSLNSALQGIVLMLGATFNRQASGDLLSAISGAPAETINQVMTVLAAQHLVERLERYGIPYYRLHETTYAFAQTWLRGSQRLEALQQKVRDSVLAYAEIHASPDRTGYDRLAAEMDTFLATAEWAAQQGDRETASRLVMALTQAGDFVKERGYVHELLRLRRLAASSTSAFPAYPISTEARAVPPIEDEDVEEQPPASAALMRTLFADDDDDDDLAYDEEIEAFDALEQDEELPSWLKVEDKGDDEADTDEGPVDITPEPSAAIDEDETEPEQEAEEEEVEDIEAAFRPAGASASVESLFAAVAAESARPAPMPEPVAVQTEPTAEEEIETPETPADLLTTLRTQLLQARQRSDQARQISLLKQIGQLQIENRQTNEAIATYGEALSVCEDSGDDHTLLDVLDILSALMVRTNNPQAAVLHAARGVQLAQRLKDSITELQLYLTLGDARQQLGESADAERAYSRALENARNSGDTQHEAIILFKLGYAQLDNSDAAGAVASWEQALKLFRAQGKRAYEGRVLGGLGTAYGDLGQWSETIRFHTSALHIAREVGDRDEELLQLSNLGYAAVQAGDLGQAVLRYRQALHLAYQSGDRDNIVSIIVDLARLLSRGPRHLAIARMLIDDALRLEPADRDVNDLKERLEADVSVRTASGVQQIAVTGTAQDYAANAYKLLEG